ncbi:MAG: hypothetical protein QOF24_901 [Verrucomicrobiota bacterium]
MGVPLSAGVALEVGEAAGDSVGDGVGVGEDLCFFFFGEALGEDSGEGIGEAFFFFGEDEALGSAFSAGVGVGAVFFLGNGDFSGDAVGFGEGEFSAIAFLFACLRGVGVGVGAKIFLSLLPNDSSALPRSATPTRPAIKKRSPAILLARRMPLDSLGGGRLRLLLRQLGQDGFVQANARVHVFEREIFIRRMGSAIA